MKRFLCLAAIALVLSACTTPDRKNKLAMAAISGTLIGASIGYGVVGLGTDGILAGFAAGTVGGVAGYAIADELLPQEQESLHRATYHSLQDMPAGQTTEWTSRDSGTTASITPMRSFRAKDGRLCRVFVVIFRIGESRESVQRTACRGPDGAWQTL